MDDSTETFEKNQVVARVHEDSKKTGFQNSLKKDWSQFVNFIDFDSAVVLCC